MGERSTAKPWMMTNLRAIPSGSHCIHASLLTPCYAFLPLEPITVLLEPITVLDEGGPWLPFISLVRQGRRRRGFV